MELIIKQLASELNLNAKKVEETIQLIDEGNTIPFIARYRKEVTGGMSDEILRSFDDRLKFLRNLESRKEEVIRLISEQDKLTPELEKKINAATVLRKVEDLYRPFKQKKQTRATKAKDKGLEPLALLMMAQEARSGSAEEAAAAFVNAEKEVNTTEEALAGARDIIAELISDNPEYREWIREMAKANGLIVSAKTKDAEESVFEQYYEYSEAVKSIPDHRILAINRGEKEKILRVKVTMPDEAILNRLNKEVITNLQSVFVGQMELAVQDAYKRLISSSIEREVRSMLTERAEEEAIKVFGKNTKPLLLIPPVRDVKVLAVDPSYRTGCKLAVLDGTGKLLEYTTIYPNKPQNKVKESRKVLVDLVKKHDIDIIPIGNGTASRETEAFVAESLKEIDKTVYYTIVSEAGASVYSASKLATEEYPDIDVSIRGAISIGRRLQDPLAELVKIDPKHIGVGQYQHDLNQKRLNETLTGVVEDCVNSVGVDLNTATPALLQYVAGISGAIAKNIVNYRDENGKYGERKQLLKVARLGNKAYEQCAGFLRIADSKNPLDNTSVHPESYETALRLLEQLNYSLEDVATGNLSDISQRIIELVPEEVKAEKLGISGKGFEALAALKKPKKNNDKAKNAKRFDKSMRKLADELEVGLPTLKDIIDEIKKPGRDPREEMPKPIFRSDVLSFEDLSEGMILTGTVRNVVDFGAFVDIGVKNDGLVHISELSDKFVKHPMNVVAVGDTVQVKIIGVDKNRGKVSLSMKGLN